MVSFPKIAAFKPWDKKTREIFKANKMEKSILDGKGISYCY